MAALFARKHFNAIVHSHHAHSCHSLVRMRTCVRRHNHVVAAKQRRTLHRLFFKSVETYCRQLSALQSLRRRTFVNDAAAGRVDNYRAVRDILL